MTKLRKAVQNLDLRKQNVIEYIPAVLGINMRGRQVVEVPNRVGFVYARFRDNPSEVVQVYNDKVSPVFGLPVLIYRDNIDRTKYRVHARDVGRYDDWGSASSFLPRHGSQHSFVRSGQGGGDIVWVYGQQFMPLLAYPSGSNGSMGVMLGEYPYYDGTGWRSIGSTGTTSLSPYKPTGNSASIVLLYADTDNGNYGFRPGDFFAANVTGSVDILQHLPALNDDEIPIAAVRLVSGTSQIGWDNLYDLRPYFTGGGSGGGGDCSDCLTGSGTTNKLAYFSSPSVIASAPHLTVGTGTMTVQPASNNTGVVVVKNAAGDDLLVVDTINGRIHAAPSVSSLGFALGIPAGTSFGGKLNAVNSSTSAPVAVFQSANINAADIRATPPFGGSVAIYSWTQNYPVLLELLSNSTTGISTGGQGNGGLFGQYETSNRGGVGLAYRADTGNYRTFLYGSGRYRISMFPDGEVGIGYAATTTSLAYKLDVSGTFRVTDNATIGGLSASVGASVRVGTGGLLEAGPVAGVQAITTKTANYTATASDYTILVDATSDAIIITLPPAASHTGRVYNIKKIDSTANTVTVDAKYETVTIDGAVTQVLVSQYESITIQSDGSNWWVL